MYKQQTHSLAHTHYIAILASIVCLNFMFLPLHCQTNRRSPSRNEFSTKKYDIIVSSNNSHRHVEHHAKYYCTTMVVDSNELPTCSVRTVYSVAKTRNGNFKYTITIYIDDDHFIWWHSARFTCRTFPIFSFVWKTNSRISTWDSFRANKEKNSLKFIEIWQHSRREVKFSTKKCAHTHTHEPPLSFMCRKQNSFHFINSILPLNCSCITDSVN